MRSHRFAPCGEIVDAPDVEDPGDVAPSADAVLSMARAFGAEPGSQGIGVLASLALGALDEAGLLEVLSLWEMQAGWVAAAQNEALCRLRDRAAERAAGEMAPAEERRCPLTGLPDSVPAGVEPDTDREWDREELSLAQAIGGFEAGRRLATATALRDRLPGAAAALAAGAISWRHADVVARATDGLDIDSAQLVERRLLADRRAVTVAQWRRRATAWVAALAPVPAEAAIAADERRDLRLWPCGDGTGQVAGTLTTEGMATVMAAVETHSAPTGPEDSRAVGQRRADALVDMCAEHLAALSGSGGGAVPAYLVVHVDGASRTGSEDLSPDSKSVSLRADLRGASLGGEPLAPSDAARLLCDADVRYVRSDPVTGAVVDLGRSRRVPDARLRAAVLIRDRETCTFPGCGRTRALHVHHLQHWAVGGPTDQANLTSLCGRHHHAVHDAGWRARRRPCGELTWTSPSGQTHTAPAAGWQPAPDPPWYEPPRRPPRSDDAAVARPELRVVRPAPVDLGDPPF